MRRPSIYYILFDLVRKLNMENLPHAGFSRLSEKNPYCRYDIRFSKRFMMFHNSSLLHEMLNQSIGRKESTIYIELKFHCRRRNCRCAYLKIEKILGLLLWMVT